MLDYEPMTEEQIDKLGLLPKGTYKFRIINAKDDISKKSGKPQINIELRIIDEDGNPKTIKGYLGTNGQYMLRILRHFCRSTGLMADYEAKNVNSEVVWGAEGIVELDIEEGQPKNDGSNKKYPDKNVIIDYLEKEQGSSHQELNDDIPF